MELIHTKMLSLICGFLYLTCFSAGLPLSESDQITLEGSGQLLPPVNDSKCTSDHLIEIRRFCPAVSNVFHEAKWSAGELLFPWIELNSDFGGNIQAINESEYGPIKGHSAPTFPDEIFTFSRPYNPEVLGKIIAGRFSYKSSPVYNSQLARNQITYSGSPTTQFGINYCIKKVWKGSTSGERLCSHTWEFKVFKSKDSSGFVVTLSREYGDKLPTK